MYTDKQLEDIVIDLPINKETASLDDVLVACTVAYFAGQDVSGKRLDTIRAELYQMTIYCIGYCNKLRESINFEIRENEKANRKSGAMDAIFQAILPTFKLPQNLAPVQIAYALTYCYSIRRIPCAGEKGNKDQDLLAVYQISGRKTGLYDADDDTINVLIHMLKPGTSPTELREIKQTLRSIAPRVERCHTNPK